MKNNISLLVGLKNNLDYTKHFYETTRKLYPEVEICFVSYGSTDGTHEWLETIADNNLKYFYSTEQKTFSDTFNKAAELATCDYVAYLHNDIVLAPRFIENIEKHVSDKRVVSYTTIEPPIFAGHERPGKLIYDLGTELETFNVDKLYEYSTKQQDVYLDKTEPGITFFMCMPRDKYYEIGGLDNLFNPMFCEDDDLIRRWEMFGMECITSLDAICYHFVSKTSRFSEEYQNRTQQIEFNSNRNFIRKWGTRRNAPKYDIGFIINNCNDKLLELLEPWCSTVYVADDDNALKKWYIMNEQKNTSYDLQERIKSIDSEKNNEILIEVDGKKFTQYDYHYISLLPDIIQDSGQPGEFRLGNALKFTIHSLTEYQNQLIHNEQAKTKKIS